MVFGVSVTLFVQMFRANQKFSLKKAWSTREADAMAQETTLAIQLAFDGVCLNQ